MASTKIGVLWLKTSKDGKTKYFSGILNGLERDINIAIFKNENKEKEGQPDYQIVRSGEMKESARGGNEFENRGEPRFPKKDFKVERGGEDEQYVPKDEQDEINVADIPF